jgi:hypothetical protein
MHARTLAPPRCAHTRIRTGVPARRAGVRAPCCWPPAFIRIERARARVRLSRRGSEPPSRCSTWLQLPALASDLASRAESEASSSRAPAGLLTCAAQLPRSPTRDLDPGRSGPFACAAQPLWPPTRCLGTNEDTVCCSGISSDH